MKKHYALLALGLTALLATSCQDETEEAVPVKSPVEEVSPTAMRAPEFPKDDGSTYLNGTPAESLLALLKVTDPAQALKLGETRITDAQYQEIKAFTDDLVKKQGCKTDEDKYRAIFYWVATTVKHENADNDPYPVFTSHKGVCQGYSNLMKVMLISQGIPTLVTNGFGWGMGHAWNYVYYDGKWRVCDATNKGDFAAEEFSTYKHLSPMRADITLFEDDNFVYDFFDFQLNISTVKKGGTQLTVPYSIEGFRVTSFNPLTALPDNIREIYIGKNIETLGSGLVGLKTTGRHLTAMYVDEANKFLRSHEGVVYQRNGEDCTLFYVPGSLNCLRLLPMEKVEKNTIIELPELEIIEFAEGTKTIEAYAVENCPNLRVAYVPQETVIATNAFYNMPSDFVIIRGSSTGIPRITY